MENQKPKLKLNYKRTFYIGMAFFTILMLWQVYNTYCPLFLSDYFVRTFGGTTADHSYLVGIIMAMDNILALFMLPLFGKWSDRTKSRLGKRMPFIIVGVAVAVIVFPLIPILFIYNKYIWMIVMMAIILLAMNVYRSPAVSLMPDITPKPLRSKANAIINLVGYLGAIFAGALAIVVPAKTNEQDLLQYDPNTIWIPFVATAVLMIVALVILLVKIKENKLAKELAPEMEEGEKLAEAESSLADDKLLTRLDKRNLIILLLSIFLWFFAFNAIETFGSLFSSEQLGLGTSWWGTAVIVMTICSLVGFVPGGYIADKLGRKWTIVLGLGLMIVALIIASFVMIPWLLYILIGIAGIGWAWINVNSYPMVVEMASKKNVGRLTGWYYAASMLAQSLTPICVGFFFKALGYGWLFPYAAIFTAIALIVFLFYKKPVHKTENNNIQGGEQTAINSTATQNEKAETTQQNVANLAQSSEKVSTTQAKKSAKSGTMQLDKTDEIAAEFKQKSAQNGEKAAAATPKKRGRKPKAESASEKVEKPATHIIPPKMKDENK